LLIRTLILLHATEGLENRDTLIRRMKKETIKRFCCVGAVWEAKNNFNFLLDQYKENSLALTEDKKRAYFSDATVPLIESLNATSKVPQSVLDRINRAVVFLGAEPLRLGRQARSQNTFQQNSCNLGTGSH